MLTFPDKAFVGRNIPKEAFYRRLNLSAELKDKFVTDIRHIVLAYKLSPDTINVGRGAGTSEILVLNIELKKPDLDYRIVESIARQNAHKLLFLLRREQQGQLAVYCGKLYRTRWAPVEDVELEVRGLDLDSVWEGFVEQIALTEEAVRNISGLSLEEKLKRQETILSLKKEIDKLERLSRNEKQPRRQFDMFLRLRQLKKRLAEERGE